MENNQTFQILIAPLDWGLGHATRCIPIIEALERRKHKIIIAGCGNSGELLKKHFPNTDYIDCPGSSFRYDKSSFPLFTQIKQSKKLLDQIRFEKRWLKEVSAQYKIDAIISDNRYGLSHLTIPSVFLTHQINVKTGLGKLSELVVRTILKQYIHRYKACWVPDIIEEGNLSGALSHPANLKIPVDYIGWLSRTEQKSDAEQTEILILLSGPEPDRSALENIMIRELSQTEKKIQFIRGLPIDSKLPEANPHIRFFNAVTQEQLSSLLQSAKLVICRSGYSSVMDIIKMQKKAVFIPTPNQPEQEYLATYLMQQKVAPFLSENKFTLEGAIQLAQNFEYTIPLYVSGAEIAANKIEALIKAQQP